MCSTSATMAKEASDEEATATNGLLEDLGGLPLAIENIAAQIRMRNSSVAKFVNIYHEKGSRIRGLSNRSSGASQHDLRSVFSLSIQSLAPDAFKLLCMLSTMSTEQTSLSLVGFHEQDYEGWLDDPLDEWVDFCEDELTYVPISGTFSASCTLYTILTCGTDSIMILSHC